MWGAGEKKLKERREGNHRLGCKINVKTWLIIAKKEPATIRFLFTLLLLFLSLVLTILLPAASNCVFLFALLLVIFIMHLQSILLSVYIDSKTNYMYLFLDTTFDIIDECVTYTKSVYVHLYMYTYQNRKGYRKQRLLGLYLIILDHGNSSWQDAFWERLCILPIYVDWVYCPSRFCSHSGPKIYTEVLHNHKLVDIVSQAFLLISSYILN